MKKPKTSIDATQTVRVPVNARLGAQPAGLHGIKQKPVELANPCADLAKPNQAESLAQLEHILALATGVRDGELASLIVSQMSAMQVWGSAENQAQRLMNAMLAVQEMEPKNATEAMLAVQIFGVHNAAIMFLKRAVTEGQTLQGTDANVLRATRLMRLFIEQLEAMAKLKGKARPAEGHRGARSCALGWSGYRGQRGNDNGERRLSGRPLIRL
jgi:hypothetical protein